LSPGHLVTRSVGALLALTAGGLIKFIAFFFGPVLLIAELRGLPTWRERWRLVLLGGAACAALVVLAYAPFWAGWETLRNVGDRRSLYTASWLATLYALLKPVVTEPRAQSIVSSLGLLLLLIGVCWACWRAWRTPQNVAAHVLWLMLWFLFLCNPWFQPWYLIWALAVVVLQNWRAQTVWGVLLFCYTALLSYVGGGLLLPALGLSETSASREFLISALIYGPPLIVLVWGHLPRPSAAWRALRQAIAGRCRRGSIAY